MSLAAGRLRHRVTLESLTRTQDADTGAVIESWVSMGTVWAGIEPLSVRDFLSADSRQSQIVARIVMRPVTGMDETWRVVHGDKVYQIAGILPDQDSGTEYVTLAVSQGPNQAGG
jgi:SPP1 family predicted phage head-tail adaptor